MRRRRANLATPAASKSRDPVHGLFERHKPRAIARILIEPEERHAAYAAYLAGEIARNEMLRMISASPANRSPISPSTAGGDRAGQHDYKPPGSCP
jgi:hypothetical protein